jgi:hypothetical protein
METLEVRSSVPSRIRGEREQLPCIDTGAYRIRSVKPGFELRALYRQVVLEHRLAKLEVSRI